MQQSATEKPRLVKSIWRLNLSLSGADTQDLRRLIRRCNVALTAIDDPYSPALLDLILPLAVQSPSVLQGLLALSNSYRSRSQVQHNRHQASLEDLVGEVIAARAGGLDAAHACRGLASSLLLSIYAIGVGDGAWGHHVRGMVGFARSTNKEELASDATGRFLLGICAFSDISALAVGRDHLSRKAWLSWMTPGSTRSIGSPFTTLEVTIGYPESLIDIIAQAAEVADDQAYCRASVSLYPTVSTPASTAASVGSYARASWPSQELEAALTRWAPPDLPEYMSSSQQVALRTAWSAIRRACFLFVWRGCGFHSNLAEPLSDSRGPESQALVGQILSELSITFDLCKTQGLSIATAMMWPLAVVGCECMHSGDSQRQKTLSLLRGMGDLFAMGQAHHLAKAFERLWDRSSCGGPSFVSLELVCRDLQIVVPLL